MVCILHFYSVLIYEDAAKITELRTMQSTPCTEVYMTIFTYIFNHHIKNYIHVTQLYITFANLLLMYISRTVSSRAASS